MTELTWAEIKTFQARLEETLIANEGRYQINDDKSDEARFWVMQRIALQNIAANLSAYKSARSKEQHAAKKLK